MSAPGGVAEVRIPDIGDFKDVPAIEILVKLGDTVKAEIRCLARIRQGHDGRADAGGGVVKEIRAKLGDKVSEGIVIRRPPTGVGAGAADRRGGCCGAARRAASDRSSTAISTGKPPHSPTPAPPCASSRARSVSISAPCSGSGGPGRILRDRRRGASPRAVVPPPAATAAPAHVSGGVDGIVPLPWPKVDFAKLGPVERKELSRIKKISAANLHRNWVVIPHVTTDDEADITELEQFRVQMNKELEKTGVKVWMLPFMVKAAVATPRKSRLQCQARRRCAGDEDTGTSASPPTRPTAWWCR